MKVIIFVKYTWKILKKLLKNGNSCYRFVLSSMYCTYFINWAIRCHFCLDKTLFFIVIRPFLSKLMIIKLMIKYIIYKKKNHNKYYLLFQD